MSLEEYTPSRAEAALANLLKDKSIDELGFEQASIDNVGNVIATRGNGRPVILLCGHMDTVPGYYSFCGGGRRGRKCDGNQGDC